MKKENGSVWWFFLIAIGFTWIFQLPRTLDSQGIVESPQFLLHLSRYLPQLGPFIAAFLLTFLIAGKDGVIKLIKRGWNTKFSKIWLIPTLLLLPAMEGLAVLSAKLFGGTAFPEPDIFFHPISYLKYLLGLLYLAALEEYGWRGFALVRLQKKWNALTSSLILGAFWGPWHLQQWFMGGAYRSNVPFLAFWFGILMQAVLLTWLFNNTKASLLPVIIFHALMNAQVFPTWGTSQSTMFFVSIWTIVTVSVVIIWGPKKLMRRKTE